MKRNIELPPADTKWGYYEDTLRTLFGEDVFAEFCEWHAHQTFMICPDTGKAIIYSDDVRQFLAGGIDLEWGPPVY